MYRTNSFVIFFMLLWNVNELCVWCLVSCLLGHNIPACTLTQCKFFLCFFLCVYLPQCVNLCFLPKIFIMIVFPLVFNRPLIPIPRMKMSRWMRKNRTGHNAFRWWVRPVWCRHNERESHTAVSKRLILWCKLSSFPHRLRLPSAATCSVSENVPYYLSLLLPVLATSTLSLSYASTGIVW